MDYLIGAMLGLGACAFGTVVGFDRDRSFYPVMLVVIASYYDLFAVMGGGAALGVETGVLALFVLASLLGLRANLWIVVAALAAHGVFDFYHEGLIANPGAPPWWPTFCLSFDVVAAAYLARRLLSKRIAAERDPGFGRRIRPHVDAELAAARAAEAAGDHAAAFNHLERAHVLGQSSTAHHVRTHVRMLLWAVRRRDRKEAMGQAARVLGALCKTWLDLVPRGNTGGANVSAIKPMPIAADLAGVLAATRAPCAETD